MSRLPTLATPGRATGSPSTSGIATPSMLRRPRASLGPGASPAVAKDRDPEMDQALKDVLRNRPPSSLSRIKDDPDTPTGSQSPYLAPGIATPRTPAFRPRTPSSVATPTSRPTSRPSLAARASLVASTTTPAGRRTSVASAASTPRPESRAGDKWAPVLGERVRLPSHGYEGTLRYLGTTHIREGIWAGVELEGAFKGRGRNDGTVDGHEYFKCAPNCGIFTLADKLAPPTSYTAGSRPASVASHRSLASSVSGRVTPAADRVRRGATTPSFGTRSVARAPKEEDTPDTAGRRTLGNSTANNAAPKITAGSRASKYIGMTAKQLNERTTTTPTPIKLGASTSASTTTPKAKTALGASTSRVARPSLGGMSTPKARTTRMSAAEMMPPPPSPQVKAPSAAAAAAAAAATVALEEEIRELKRRNAELEEHASSSEQARAEQYDAAAAQADELEAQIELARKEADELRAQLTSSADDADGVRARGEQLATEVAAKAGEIEELQKRAALHAGELEAGIAAKHKAQNEADEMKRLVDELTAAGNQIIELNESKQYESELKIRELQAQLATAAEDLARAKEGSEAAAAALENSSSPKRAVTAAEIDNETLTEQVKHQQKRIANLEEQLDEVRGQAEADAEAWQVKYDKACAAERAVIESLEQVRRDLQDRDLDVEEHATRNVELQGAMSEKQRMLEAARADIEALRAEASTASEASIADLDNKLKEATDKLSAGVDKIFELEARVSELSEENGMLRAKAENDNDDAYDGISPKAKRTLSLSNGSMDDAERVGFRHIIADLRAENADQQEKLNLLEEENTLLHELKGSEEAGEDEAAKLRGTVAKQAQTIKEYEREVSELESLIESKIYREDELETRVQELEDMWSKNGGAGAAGAAPASSASVTTRAPKHTRTDSAVSNGTARSDLRCELCEGPHELDACPVFSSTTLDADVDAEADADADAHPSPLANKNKKWCNDCESSAHDTAECPMAEDVF